MSQNGAYRESQPLRRFGAWLAALALAVQVFLVQPHVHVGLTAPPHASTAYASDALAGSAHGSAARDHYAAFCALCHAFARGGLPAAQGPTLGLVAHTLLDITPAPIVASAHTFPAHHWLSRGPPSA